MSAFNNVRPLLDADSRTVAAVITNDHALPPYVVINHNYYHSVVEAKSLRDWLNAVLRPDSPASGSPEHVASENDGSGDANG